MHYNVVKKIGSMAGKIKESLLFQHGEQITLNHKHLHVYDSIRLLFWYYGRKTEYKSITYYSTTRH